MPPSDFAKANVAQILEWHLTDEAIQLIAGVGFWHTYVVPRLGVPAVKVSDGPNDDEPLCYLLRIILYLWSFARPQVVAGVPHSDEDILRSLSGVWLPIGSISRREFSARIHQLLCSHSETIIRCKNVMEYHPLLALHAYLAVQAFGYKLVTVIPNAAFLQKMLCTMQDKVNGDGDTEDNSPAKR